MAATRGRDEIQSRLWKGLTWRYVQVRNVLPLASLLTTAHERQGLHGPLWSVKQHHWSGMRMLQMLLVAWVNAMDSSWKVIIVSVPSLLAGIIWIWLYFYLFVDRNQVNSLGPENTLQISVVHSVPNAFMCVLGSSVEVMDKAFSEIWEGARRHRLCFMTANPSSVSLCCSMIVLNILWFLSPDNFHNIDPQISTFFYKKLWSS